MLCWLLRGSSQGEAVCALKELSVLQERGDTALAESGIYR